jgi:UDP-glucose 4-epimerase
VKQHNSIQKIALVIGSNGFLGSRLTQQLAALNWDVTGAYHNDTSKLYNKIEQLPISEVLKTSLNFDSVFICSAFIPRNKEEEASNALEAVNVQLTREIVAAFPDSRIIYCSSVSVYPFNGATHRENTPPNPETPYGQSKLAGEAEVGKHPNYAIVRFSSLYGPDMFANTFLPYVVRAAVRKNNISLFGDGSRKQNYLHVADAVNYLIHAAAAKENGVFLATSKSSYSNAEIGTLLEDLLNKSLITFVGKDESPSFVYNNEQTRTALNITSERPIKQGLKELIEWQQKQS